MQHLSKIYREIFVGLIVDFLMHENFTSSDVDTQHIFRVFINTHSFEKEHYQIGSFNVYLKQKQIKYIRENMIIISRSNISSSSSSISSLPLHLTSVSYDFVFCKKKKKKLFRCASRILVLMMDLFIKSLANVLLLFYCL